MTTRVVLNGTIPSLGTLKITPVANEVWFMQHRESWFTSEDSVGPGLPTRLSINSAFKDPLLSPNGQSTITRSGFSGLLTQRFRGSGSPLWPAGGNAPVFMQNEIPVDAVTGVAPISPYFAANTNELAFFNAFDTSGKNYMLCFDVSSYTAEGIDAVGGAYAYINTSTGTNDQIMLKTTPGYSYLVVFQGVLAQSGPQYSPSLFDRTTGAKISNGAAINALHKFFLWDDLNVDLRVSPGSAAAGAFIRWIRYKNQDLLEYNDRVIVREAFAVSETKVIAPPPGETWVLSGGPQLTYLTTGHQAVNLLYQLGSTTEYEELSMPAQITITSDFPLTVRNTSTTATQNLLMWGYKIYG